MNPLTAENNARDLARLARLRDDRQRTFDRLSIDPQAPARPLFERVTFGPPDRAALRAARSVNIPNDPEAERQFTRLEANALDPQWRQAASTATLIDSWRALVDSASAREDWNRQAPSPEPTAALNKGISERVGADWSEVEEVMSWFTEADQLDNRAHLDSVIADPSKDIVLDGILRSPDREWSLNQLDIEDPHRPRNALLAERQVVEYLAHGQSPSGVAYDGPARHLERDTRLTITSHDEVWIAESLSAIRSDREVYRPFYDYGYGPDSDDLIQILYNDRAAHEGPPTPDELRDWITGLNGLELGPDDVTVSISDDYEYQVHLVGTDLQVREWNRAFTSPSNPITRRRGEPDHTLAITPKAQAPAPFNAAETAGPQQTPAPAPQRADAALRLAQQSFPTSLSESLQTQAPVHARPTVRGSQTATMHLGTQPGHER